MRNLEILTKFTALLYDIFSLNFNFSSDILSQDPIESVSIDEFGH